MAGTAAILLLNWLACTVYVARSGVDYPWWAFATFDYAAGFVILALLRSPPTAWQASVGLIYALELVAHAAQVINGNPTAVYYGWHLLRYAAWAQVALVFAWGGYELLRRRVHVVRRVSSRDDIACGSGTSVGAPR